MDLICYPEGAEPVRSTWDDLRREFVEAGDVSDQDMHAMYLALRDGGFCTFGGGSAPFTKVRRAP